MAEPRIKVSLSDDRSTASVEFLPASGASGTLTLAADALLQFIQSLGQVRAAMIAGAEIPPLEGQTLPAIFNTRWYVQPEMIGEATAISFYHPGFGPLAFLIPIDQVGYLASLLQTQFAAWRASRGVPQ